MINILSSKWIQFLLPAMLLVPIVTANMIDTILFPFSGMDLSQTYDSYSAFIDLIIYAILFIGLSQATLGKRFQSRGGKAVVSAVGIVLALGLAVSENTLGFNLRSFGPLAAGIFIFFVGFTLYLGIKTAGMNTVNAGSIALVVTYFSIRAVAPSYFDWLSQNAYAAWIHAILLIAVLISMYKVFRLILPGRDKNLVQSTKALLLRSANQPKDLLEQLNSEKREKEFVETRLNKFTVKEDKTTKEIITDLTELKKLIEEFGNDEKGCQIIAKKLETIFPKEREVITVFQALKQQVEKYSNFDNQHFQQLKKEYHSLSNSQKKEIKEEIKDEWKKLAAEKTILKFEKDLEGYHKNVQHTIQMVIASLNVKRLEDALKWIDETIHFEKKSLRQIRNMRHLELALDKYVNREINITKQELSKVS